MKPYIYWIAIACSFLFFPACEDNQAPGIKMEYNVLINIPPGLNTVERHFFLADNVSTEKDFYLQSVAIADIRNIQVTSVLVFQQGTNLDFSTVRRASLKISPQGANTWLEAAYREIVPSQSSLTLDLIPSLVDFKDVMTGQNFDMRLELEFFEPTNTLANCVIRMNMEAYE